MTNLRERRLEILHKVELGELSVDESNRLLEKLEIEIEEAVPVLLDEQIPSPSVEPSQGFQGTPTSSAPESQPSGSEFEEGRYRHWRWIAQIPFWFSVGFTALSAYWMYQGYMKSGFGWGFFLSWIPFVIGLAGMFIFWGARWLHVRIRQRAGKKPAMINISLPLPLRAIGWFMRTFSKHMPRDLQEKRVDEMMTTLDESLTKDTPFHVFVDDEDGEQVEVYIG